MKPRVASAVLLLPLLLLIGCTSSASSPPTASVPVPEIAGGRSVPTVGQTREPAGASPLSTTLPSARPSTVPTHPPTAPPTPALVPTTPPALVAPLFSYPIGTPGKPLGDGFFIRHGSAVENTWYNPNYWHTGEDWYAIEGDTAGAAVFAVADGEVVYAGANYPGRVVIVRHADDLFSMYGHLDPALGVRVGQRVARGELIGTVLRRGDETPNHLHFEVRTFLTARAVNGSAPRYGFRCGVNCPPGPGYWPIDAPDLPSDLGWRNPVHVIADRMFSPDRTSDLGEVVVATHAVSRNILLWSAPPNDALREAHGQLELRSGERFPLLEARAGPEDTHQTSALAYELWYHIQLPDGRTGWVQAAIPSIFETGSDHRPSSIFFNFFPAIDTPPI
jgi:hypothetical protein